MNLHLVLSGIVHVTLPRIAFKAIIFSTCNLSNIKHGNMIKSSLTDFEVHEKKNISLKVFNLYNNKFP